MNKIAFLILVFISGSQLFAQADKTKKLLIGDKVEMSVPVSFNQPVRVVMNDSSSKILVNQDQRVMIIYLLATSNMPNAVNVSDNDIPQWTDKQLSAHKIDRRFEYIDDGIFLQDGKNIGYIKYKTDEEDSLDTYTLLFFMSVDGKLFQAQFNCPYKTRKRWEPIADEIANSLRIINAN
jgi:hypothetical protein